MISSPNKHIIYIPLCICLETKPVFLMPRDSYIYIYPQRIDDYRHRPDSTKKAFIGHDQMVFVVFAYMGVSIVLYMFSMV
jgi:hypothetical protein